MLAQLWAVRSTAAEGPVVFVNASDGVGVGIALDGQLVRGARNGAGEFGHIPLTMDGPLCGCGLRGCWETYVRSARRWRATSDAAPRGPSRCRRARPCPRSSARAHGGEAHARDVLEQTGDYLGRGLAIVIKAVQPARIYMSGEITDGVGHRAAVAACACCAN